MIFVWKITQSLVRGYDMSFSLTSSRLGRQAQPAPVVKSAAASVRHAREASLAVKGAHLFNLLPAQLRNSDHGDILMFKNHLDIFLTGIPDQPTTAGLVRGPETNSLLHQIPQYLMNCWY